MSGRKRILYTYKRIEVWEEYDEQARSIIQEDTSTENWICNRALPPTCYPPPLTVESIEKLKNLTNGIVVEEIEED
ncbi:hypothetical protein BDV26DRAFT_298116 [Aspergillus bertholletiae]|uniref:Uncharacterized protein n=1 Tax=Aspergillus bertholletiae TaxID=1226010 RepID=A0A5N7AS56_9EURO|nr:hypothetical protein BDV26DRAFT_298116 [Aspergillus bertholletiae]